MSLEIFHKKCLQKVSNKCVHQKCKKKCPLKRPEKRVHKVSTKNVRKKCQKVSQFFFPQNVSTKGIHKNCQKVSTKRVHKKCPPIGGEKKSIQTFIEPIMPPAGLPNKGLIKRLYVQSAFYQEKLPF